MAEYAVVALNEEEEHVLGSNTAPPLATASVVELTATNEGLESKTNHPARLTTTSDLTWTDNYFANEMSDVLAVFDYDEHALHEHEIESTLLSISILLSMPVLLACLFLVPFPLSIEAAVLTPGMCMISFLLLTPFAKKVYEFPVPELPHTATKRRSIRYAEPKLGYELDIPYEAIVSVEVKRTNLTHNIATVTIEMMSIDGMEFVVHGFPPNFPKTSNGNALLQLIGLKEPICFKRLVTEQTEKATRFASKTTMESIEASLESDNAEDWKRALGAARDELRRVAHVRSGEIV